MTEATLTPAAALAERVLEATRSAGQLDVAPGRKAMAIRALDDLGYPTTRDERWKYTRVARIQQWEPRSAQSDTPAEVLPGLDAHRLTFVDGRFLSGRPPRQRGHLHRTPCPPPCPPIPTGFPPSKTIISRTTSGSRRFKPLRPRMAVRSSSPTA